MVGTTLVERSPKSKRRRKMNEIGESSEVGSECVPQSATVVTAVKTEEQPSPSTQTPVVAVADNDEATNSEKIIRSILKTCTKPKQMVRFADDHDEDLVTYQEPSNCNAWTGVPQPYTNEEILEGYYNACNKVLTAQRDVIVQQLKDIKDNMDYSATLNLTSVTLDHDALETLEIIFQMVTFRSIFIGRCLPVHAAELFNMLEFYDPAMELIVSDMDREDITLWGEFASVISSSMILNAIQFREMCLGDQSLRTIFENGINENNNIIKLRFDGCELSRAPTFMLAHHLKINDHLCELHLCYLDLYSKEAEILAKFLSINESLRILDLSNNRIGDHGFDVLSNGLLDQSKRDVGVEVLILVNNQLTKKSVKTLDAIIANCPLINTINVGLNNLTDKAIVDTMNSIKKSETLHGLGLQSTLITCSGIIKLADICMSNTSLRHINLRGNKAVQPDTLNNLADAIHRTSLVHIDLDDNNRSCSDPQKYCEIVNKVRRVIAINKVKVENEYPSVPQQDYDLFLNCDPVYVPLSHTRTRSSSNLKNRFSVSPVSEVTPSPSSSRFTVVPCIDLPVDPEKSSVLGAVGGKKVPLKPVEVPPPEITELIEVPERFGVGPIKVTRKLFQVYQDNPQTESELSLTVPETSNVLGTAKEESSASPESSDIHGAASSESSTPPTAISDNPGTVESTSSVPDVSGDFVSVWPHPAKDANQVTSVSEETGISTATDGNNDDDSNENAEK
ncbi:hypothetical protein ILUMI_22378 [Ignelater luminosus]|uniref:Uncharacterized protein n=1 Tax=Ignelater luminosus TaxID=2038154 RepID=A0A8K0CGU7_IGNLU|nr:hypothetical protein ILUMI_22378 [Ignelater luminosus]